MDMFNWKDLLKSSLKHLPGESAHIEMIPYRLPSSSFVSESKKAKQSAVMCLFYEQNSEVFGLLMERTDDGGKHSGQISFPGGKKDLSDIDLKQTALRETFEEIGISKEIISVLGELTKVYIPVSNFLIQPYIGIIGTDFKLNLSIDEVKSVFSFSVTDLLNPNTKQNKTIKNHNGIGLKNIPCFVFGDKVVWGATALILNEIKELFANS